MTHRTFLISDTHFGHEKCCTVFKMPDGVTPLRPFSGHEEMDEFMVKAWNDVVRPQDKVYHLGDVVINRKFLSILSRLNGHKKLIRGNHDIFPIKDYLMYFEEVYATRLLDHFIMSHIPLSETCLTARYGVNVHGHLHAHEIDSPLYLNVSVEKTNFAPIELPDVLQMIEAKQGQYPDFVYPAKRKRPDDQRTNVAAD